MKCKRGRSGAGLHDDVEVGVAEGDLAHLPLLRQRRVETSSNSTTSDFFTAKTVSDSMYSLPATKMCVVSGRCPAAATMKWMCAGRNACRPVALSSSPTGPSVGIG